MKKPFPWYGGKDRLSPLLVSLLPVHQVYVEVFGGSGGLLFAKPESPLEVFNDLDHGVVNFFRVLRDSHQTERLVQLLSLTPYSNEEYHDCLKHWQETDDPVEKARAWYCGVVMSMNASIRTTGWRHSKVPGKNPAAEWQRGVARMPECTARLARVQIDHRDFEAVIRSYDSQETCFYLDPTYLEETRQKSRCYPHEMSKEDHQRLLSCILSVEGMVILSGYDHPLYQEALSHWNCIERTVACPSVAMNAHSPSTRVECIWRSPSCLASTQTPMQLPLFAQVNHWPCAKADKEVSNDKRHECGLWEVV